MVIGVSGNTDKLIGLPLDGGSRWTFAHPIDARPVVAGQVVVGSGGGEVFALEASTGSVLWRRATGGTPLLGAGDDGITVVTFHKAGSPGSSLLAVTHGGQVVQQLETDRPLGAPAVIGRLAFVPWSGQNTSRYRHGQRRRERPASRSEQTSRAWTQGLPGSGRSGTSGSTSTSRTRPEARRRP